MWELQAWLKGYPTSNSEVANLKISGLLCVCTHKVRVHMHMYTYINAHILLNKVRYNIEVDNIAQNEWLFVWINLFLFIRSMTSFRGDSKVMKLFAKHIKVSKGPAVLGGRCCDPYRSAVDLSFSLRSLLLSLASSFFGASLHNILNDSGFLCIPASALPLLPSAVTALLLHAPRLLYGSWGWTPRFFEDLPVFFYLDVNLLCPRSWP